MKQIKMQIAAQTHQLPLVEEVGSTMQIQDQELACQKGAVETQQFKLLYKH